MKVTYNPGMDTLRILLCDAPIQASETHHTGLILDYDHNGRIVGLEITAASEHMSRPSRVDFLELTDMSREDNHNCG